jgi:hypothetical protein
MEIYFRIMDINADQVIAWPNPPPPNAPHHSSDPCDHNQKIVEHPGFAEHPVYRDPPDVPRNPDLPR